MKRSTAIRHLEEVAATATDLRRLQETNMGWPLVEMWVAGELLGPAESLDWGTAVLILDVPADEAPWLAAPAAGEWVAYQLRLGKRPMSWFYRPAGVPVWNHELRRVARFWTADAGIDTTALDALRTRRLDGLAVVEPSTAQLIEQLHLELPISRCHLNDVLDHFADREWRRDHGRGGELPEDHLWRAAKAVAEMLHALDELQSNPTRHLKPV